MKPLLSSLFIVLIVISNGYQGIVTRDMTAPLKEKEIENMTELALSYKFKLLLNVEPEVALLTTKFDYVFEKYNISKGKESFIIAPLGADLRSPELFGIMAEEAGARIGHGAVAYLSPFFTTSNNLRIRNVSCFFIRDNIGETNVFQTTRLHFSIQAYHFLRTMSLSGIWNLLLSVENQNFIMHFLKVGRNNL